MQSQQKTSFVRNFRVRNLEYYFSRLRYEVAKFYFFFEEFLYRFPNPYTKRKNCTITTRQSRACALELKKNGFVVLPGFVKAEDLLLIQSDFEKMVKDIRQQRYSETGTTPRGYIKSIEYQVHGEMVAHKATFSNDPFRFSPHFLRCSLHPLLLAIVSDYLGKSFILQQAIAQRLEPIEHDEYGSWQWHHDGWGRKLNILFFFTEIGPRDQGPTVLTGSHNLYHEYDRCIQSRFTQVEVSQLCQRYPHFTPTKITGPAGTVCILDSNCLHRGNRTLGRQRDTLITSFNAGRYQWSFSVPAAQRTFLDRREIEFLERHSKVIFHE